jgi:hypothetical protein
MAIIELAAIRGLEGNDSIVAEHYREGRAGMLMRAAQGVHRLRSRAGAPRRAGTTVGAVASRRLLAAGAPVTRFGVFDAGTASAKDPKYTVIPHRERMIARRNEHASILTR